MAVDRLTKVVGATRGSFYWHFKDRDELVEAALALWEREYTTELIPLAEAVPDPQAPAALAVQTGVRAAGGADRDRARRRSRPSARGARVRPGRRRRGSRSCAASSWSWAWARRRTRAPGSAGVLHRPSPARGRSGAARGPGPDRRPCSGREPGFCGCPVRCAAFYDPAVLEPGSRLNHRAFEPASAPTSPSTHSRVTSRSSSSATRCTTSPPRTARWRSSAALGLTGEQCIGVGAALAGTPVGTVWVVPSSWRSVARSSASTRREDLLYQAVVSELAQRR